MDQTKSQSGDWRYFAAKAFRKLSAMEGKQLLEHKLRVLPEEGYETVFDLKGDGGETVKSIEITRKKLPDDVPHVIPETPIKGPLSRAHTFNDVESFIEYVHKEATQRAVILGDIKNRRVTCVLDEAGAYPYGNSDVKCEQECVYFEPIEHPLFTPWTKLSGWNEVREFAMFLMQNRRAVAEPDGMDLAYVFSQVQMSKAITLQAGVGKKAINGVVCEVDIAGEKKGMPVELPDSIVLSLPIFVGGKPIRIIVDLHVTHRSDAIMVFCSFSDVEAQKIEAFEQMLAMIRNETGRLVGLGRVQLTDWRRLPYINE